MKDIKKFFRVFLTVVLLLGSLYSIGLDNLDTAIASDGFVKPRPDGQCPGTGQDPNSAGWCNDSNPGNGGLTPDVGQPGLPVDGSNPNGGGSWGDYCGKSEGCDEDGGGGTTEPTTPPPPPPPPPPTYSINFNSSVSNNSIVTNNTSSSKMNQNIEENKETSLGNMSNGNEKTLNMYFSDNTVANKQGYKNYYQPELTVVDNEKTYALPVKSNTVGSASKSTLEKVYKDFSKTLVSIELYAYNGDKFKSIPNDLKELLNNKDALVESTTLDSKQSLTDLNGFKVKGTGNYIFVAKANFKDTTKESKIIATTINLNELDKYSKLPVKNRLSILLDNQKINEGKQSANHNFNSLTLPTFNSMKVLSAYDSNTHTTLVGSASGGLKLFDSKNTEVPLTSSRPVDTVSVSQVIPSDEGFIVSTYNDGMYLVNAVNKTLSQLNSITDTKLNATTTNDSVVIVTSDNHLTVLRNEKDGLHLRKQLTSKDIFGKDIKLGEVNLVGGKLLVNTLYGQSDNKTAVLSLN